MINSYNTSPKHPTINGTHRHSESFESEKQSGLLNFQALLSKLRNGIEINIDHNADHLTIDLSPRQRPQIDYRALKSHVGVLPSLHAVAGWNPSDQKPTTLHFLGENWQHLLITGEGKTGKSGLLKTILSDLALNTKPAHLQYALIDGYRGEPDPIRRKRERLSAFEYLPHTLAYTSHSSSEAAELIAFIRDELDYRAQYEIKTPTILLVIEDYHDHFANVPYETIEDLTYIANVGAQHGIKLILTGNPPTHRYIQDILETAPFARMVGRIKDRETAEVATCLLDSHAEKLQRKGEFLLIQENEVSHFLAAALQNNDFQKIIDSIYHQKLPVLLAHSFSEEQPFETEAMLDPLDQDLNTYEPVQPEDQSVVDDSHKPEAEPTSEHLPANEYLPEDIPQQSIYSTSLLRSQAIHEPNAVYQADQPEKFEQAYAFDADEEISDFDQTEETQPDLFELEEIKEGLQRPIKPITKRFTNRNRIVHQKQKDLLKEQTDEIRDEYFELNKQAKSLVDSTKKTVKEIGAVENEALDWTEETDPWLSGLIEEVEEEQDKSTQEIQKSLAFDVDSSVQDKAESQAQHDLNTFKPAKRFEEEVDQSQDDDETIEDVDFSTKKSIPRPQKPRFNELGNSPLQKRNGTKKSVKKRPPIIKLNNGENQ